ncbi:MAG: C39 family peptidase, partial [Candidatus Aenigmarchaeota archaeon]|nr:C39 family peptidase [Candidatus Aenigmarchaeota archaeon]
MRMLDVPFRKQKLANSCFPACVKMVLGYYGDDIDEKELYENSVLPGHPGAWDVRVSQFLINKGYKVTSYWNGKQESWWGVKQETANAYRREMGKALEMGFIHRQNAGMPLIRKFIDTNIPVLAEVDADVFYGEKLGCTHMVVVVGYDEDNFYVHDPDKKGGGKTRAVPIRRFRKAWERLSPMAGRSLFVIEPKGHKKA